jgi:hypothetical protein
MEEHGEAIGATGTSQFGLFQQGGLTSAVDRVVDEMLRGQEAIRKG